MLPNTLRGLKIGLFAGFCYWFVDTRLMFFVMEWKMGSPSSGLVPESFWLFVASLAIYGALGLLAGLAMDLRPGGLFKPLEALWQKERQTERFARLTARGPLKPIQKVDSTLVVQVMLTILIPMHVLVFVISPEFDDIMGVGFLILHLGVALFVALSYISLIKPVITAALVITSTAGMSARSRTRGSVAGGDAGLSVMPARLARTTVPAYARDSKWSPTPTAGQTGSAVRSRIPQGIRSAVSAGGASRDRSASGPASCRAFSLMAWCLPS